MTALPLLCAGVLAGALGTAGGIASLISYPALLLTGLSPLHANVANNVSYVAALPGSALGSRPELAGEGGWLGRWASVLVLGAGAGATLLVVTPPGVFAAVVPALVLIAVIAFLLEDRLRRSLERHRIRHRRLALLAGLTPVSLYHGYFGAGSGVMIITLLMVLAGRRLPKANALKNMLEGFGCLCTASVLIAFAPVSWSATLPLAGGILIGSRLGPIATRRLPLRVVKPAIALIGVALALELWLNPGG